MDPVLLALSGTNRFAAAGLIVCLVLGAVVLLWSPRPGSARIGRPKNLPDVKHHGDEDEQIELGVEDPSPAEDGTSGPEAGSDPGFVEDATAEASDASIDDVDDVGVSEPGEVESPEGTADDEPFGGFDEDVAADGVADDDVTAEADAAEPAAALDGEWVAHGEPSDWHLDDDVALDGLADDDGAVGVPVPPPYTGPVPRAPLFDADDGRRAAQLAAQLREQALRHGAAEDLRPLFGTADEDLRFPGEILAEAIMGADAATEPHDEEASAEAGGPDEDALDAPAEDADYVDVDVGGDPDDTGGAEETSDPDLLEAPAEPDELTDTAAADDVGLDWTFDGPQSETLGGGDGDAPAEDDAEPALAEDGELAPDAPEVPDAPFDGVEFDELVPDGTEASGDDVAYGDDEADTEDEAAPTGWAVLPQAPDPAEVDAMLSELLDVEAADPAADIEETGDTSAPADEHAAEVDTDEYDDTEDDTGGLDASSIDADHSAQTAVWVTPPTAPTSLDEPAPQAPSTRLDSAAERRAAKAEKARERMMRKAAREAEREAKRSQRRLEKAAEREAKEAEKARKAARKLSGTRLARSSRRRGLTATDAVPTADVPVEKKAPAIVVERVDHEAFGLPEPIPPRRRTTATS